MTCIYVLAGSFCFLFWLLVNPFSSIAATFCTGVLVQSSYNAYFYDNNESNDCVKLKGVAPYDEPAENYQLSLRLLSDLQSFITTLS